MASKPRMACCAALFLASLTHAQETVASDLTLGIVPRTTTRQQVHATVGRMPDGATVGAFDRRLLKWKLSEVRVCYDAKDLVQAARIVPQQQLSLRSAVLLFDLHGGYSVAKGCPLELPKSATGNVAGTVSFPSCGVHFVLVDASGSSVVAAIWLTAPGPVGRPGEPARVDVFRAVAELASTRSERRPQPRTQPKTQLGQPKTPRKTQPKPATNPVARRQPVIRGDLKRHLLIHSVRVESGKEGRHRGTVLLADVEMRSPVGAKLTVLAAVREPAAAGGREPLSYTVRRVVVAPHASTRWRTLRFFIPDRKLKRRLRKARVREFTVFASCDDLRAYQKIRCDVDPKKGPVTRRAIDLEGVFLAWRPDPGVSELRTTVRAHRLDAIGVRSSVTFRMPGANGLKIRAVRGAPQTARDEEGTFRIALNHIAKTDPSKPLVMKLPVTWRHGLFARGVSQRLVGHVTFVSRGCSASYALDLVVVLP